MWRKRRLILYYAIQERRKRKRKSIHKKKNKESKKHFVQFWTYLIRKKSYEFSLSWKLLVSKREKKCLNNFQANHSHWYKNKNQSRWLWGLEEDDFFFFFFSVRGCSACFGILQKKKKVQPCTCTTCQARAGTTFLVFFWINFFPITYQPS